MRYLKPYCYSYLNGAINYYGIKNFKDIDVIGSPWINYMKAGEFNPPHNHPLGQFSMVIYLQIPKELVKEYEETKDDHNSEGPGAICFQYGERLPFNICRYWRMPTEGMLIVFPAWLQHYVHSFTSNVERISVSGNIRFMGIRK